MIECFLNLIINKLEEYKITYNNNETSKEAQ